MDHEAAEAQGIVDAVLGLPVLRLVRLRRDASVAIAGVLLVFCYLIVPSVAAMLFAERIGPRLAIGWTMGTSSRRWACTCR